MSDVQPPLSSPAERRRLRVRTSILDAADKVFAEGGEDGLSIRRLADEIDYSPAAIYKYFGSKDELLSELKDAFFRRILEQIALMQNSDKPFLERARGCLRTYVNTALEQPQHYLAAFVGVTDHSSADGPAASKVHAFDYLVSVVEEGQQLGVFHTRQSARLLAKSIWTSTHGAAMLMAHLPNFPHMDDTVGSTQDRAEFLDLHIDQILGGLQNV